MKRYLYLFFAAAVIGCAGCASVGVSTEGTKIEKDKLSSIRPGVTTRQAVIETFGNPASVSDENNEEKLTYTYNEKKVPTYMGGLVENETQLKKTESVLEITIKGGVVSSYRFRSSQE